MNTRAEHDLEQRLLAAGPSPGGSPDVDALWRKARGSHVRRRVGGALAVGFVAAGVVVALPPQPTVELSPGAGAAPPETAFDEARYCTETASFLGAAAGGNGAGAPEDVSTEGFDFQASHETMAEEFARAGAVAPPELADAWSAVRADLEAQGEVWASVDWDPEQAGGFPALIQQLNSLPTSAEGSSAMATLTSDYASRCVPD